MTQADDRPRGDPWNAFGYLVAGVLTYGAIGYGLDLWWGTGFLVAVGILFGAGLGLYMTWARFKPPDEQVGPTASPRSASSPPSSDDPS